MNKKSNWLRVLALVTAVLATLLPRVMGAQEVPPTPQKTISTEIVNNTHLIIYVSQADNSERVQVASVKLGVVHPNFLDMLSLSPDETEIVYVTNHRSLDDARVWIAQTDGSGSQEIANLGSEFWSAPPVWSPDSRRLAYALIKKDGAGVSGLELWIINADGSSPTRLVRDSSFTVDLFVGRPSRMIRWTADSAHIRHTNDNSDPPRIYEVDIASGLLKDWPSVNALDEWETDSIASVLSLPCSVTSFSQQDPAFQPDLHTASCLSPYNWTMATGGCAITSLAMMLKYYGVNTNPRILDDTLGSSRCPLSSHWAEVATVGGAGSDVTYVGVWDGAQWSMLQNDLAAGKPVVVLLYHNTWGSHYVLAINGSGSSAYNYTVVNPLGGATQSMGDFYSAGYYFAGLIRYSGTPHCQQDHTPPTTSRSLSGASGENGWYVSSVQVTLSASDNSGGSGVKLIQYRIDSGSWHIYSSPFTVSGDGSHTVRYKAQDNAGNWESEKQVSMRIDTAAPTGSLTINNGATTAPGVLVRVGPSASDATSGVYQLRLRDAGGSWSDWRSFSSRVLWQLPAITGQSHTVEIQFKDRAGNTSATYSRSIYLDVYPARPASAGYRLARSTWGAAPWDKQSAHYRLQGTVGQPSMIGILSSANYRLSSGYWTLGHADHYTIYLPLVVRNN